MILICLKKYKTLLAFFAMLLLAAPFASAQQSVALSVSPTIFEMTANPEQRWESSLRIINVNPFELTVYAEVMNFKPLGEKGASQFIPIDPSSEESTFAEWIKVQSGPIVIPAEQTLQIPITIELPSDVPPGGHYASILIGTKPPEDTKGKSQVSTAQVVSSLLFLRVSGDITESGRIRSFRAANSIISKPETTFELRFENLGNVHLQPQGEIRIKNMWGQERGTIPVNQQTLFGNVLRDSTRNFSFEWTSEWSIADIGRYTAEATLAYGEDARQFTSADTSFWLIPWKILLSIVAVLAAIIIFASWLIRLYVKKMLALAGVDADHPVSNRSRSRSVASLVAPIEVGILDLRKRIDRRTSNTELVPIIFSFVRANYLFFVGIIIGFLVLYVVGWYVMSALSSNRSYEVVVDNDAGPVTISSEDVAYEELQKKEENSAAEKRSTPPIVIVNRSGKNGAAAALASNLEELGFTIERLDTEIGTIEERTVIVYDPTFNEDALQLSTILDNAPISAYEPSEGEPAFTIYIGEELAGKIE